MPDLLNPQQFAAKIRAAHPGAYDDVPDLQLTTKVLAKFPQYHDMVQLASPEVLAAQAQNRATAAKMAPINASYGSDPSKPKALMPATGAPSVGEYLDTLGGELAGAGKGAINSVVQTANLVGEGMSGPGGAINALVNPPKRLEPQGTAEKTGNFIEGGAELAAGFTKAAQALPNAGRAGGLFQEVMSKAGNVPVDVNKVGQAALEAQQLAQSGGAMPKVVRDFLRRSTDPNKPPLTYEEARDFYSNATRISADEANRLTPVMKRSLGKFTQSLGESISGAAGSVGQGENYANAMSEYRNAMRLKGYKDNVIEALIKYGVRGAGAGLGIGAGAEAAHQIIKK